MKKVSTRAAAQSGNISQQRLTIGLDLGDRNGRHCVLDEAGQIQLESADGSMVTAATRRGEKPCLVKRTKN